MKFNDAADEFLEFIEVTKAKGTYEYNCSKMPPLKQFFKNRTIFEVDKRILVKFIKFMKDRNPKVTHVTINKHISIIKRILDYNEIILKFDKLPEIKKRLLELVC